MNGSNILKIMIRIKGIVLGLAITSMLTGCKVEKDDDNSTITEKNVSTASEEKEEISSVEDEVDHVSIDWNHYENQMSEAGKENFSDYLSVLNNKEKFQCIDLNNESIYFHEYLSALKVDSIDEIGELTFVDLDNQNGDELVIEMNVTGGHYFVLSRDNGVFVGINMSARSFEELQKDGKYLAAGGAGDLYFRRMKIDSSGVEETLIGEVHGEEKEDGSYGDRLEVGGQVISESLEDWMAENYNDPVEWIQ